MHSAYWVRELICANQPTNDWEIQTYSPDRGGSAWHLSYLSPTILGRHLEENPGSILHNA